MFEAKAMKLAVGDEVRIHFHPSGPWRSFSEGVIRRVDVTTPEGRFFVLEVRNEVLLDQPHRIRPNFHDYIRYENRNDFPGRIEVLSIVEQLVEREPAFAPLSAIPPEGSIQEAGAPPLLELEDHTKAEVESVFEAEADHEPIRGNVEPQPVRKQSGLLSAIFGRR